MDFDHLSDLDQRGTWWVIWAKDNMKYRAIQGDRGRLIPLGFRVLRLTKLISWDSIATQTKGYIDKTHKSHNRRTTARMLSRPWRFKSRKCRHQPVGRMEKTIFVVGATKIAMSDESVITDFRNRNHTVSAFARGDGTEK